LDLPVWGPAFFLGLVMARVVVYLRPLFPSPSAVPALRRPPAHPGASLGDRAAGGCFVRGDT
ncbi:MAG: hypothetical protein ACFB03_13430, partial [Paracoccaceae bacterium]